MFGFNEEHTELNLLRKGKHRPQPGVGRGFAIAFGTCFVIWLVFLDFMAAGGSVQMMPPEMSAVHAVAGGLLLFYARSREYNEFAKGVVIGVSISLLLDVGCWAYAGYFRP